MVPTLRSSSCARSLPPTLPCAGGFCARRSCRASSIIPSSCACSIPAKMPAGRSSYWSWYAARRCASACDRDGKLPSRRGALHLHLAGARARPRAQPRDHPSRRQAGEHLPHRRRRAAGRLRQRARRLAGQRHWRQPDLGNARICRSGSVHAGPRRSTIRSLFAGRRAVRNADGPASLVARGDAGAARGTIATTAAVSRRLEPASPSIDLIADLLAFLARRSPASGEDAILRSVLGRRGPDADASKCSACGVKRPQDVPRCLSCGVEVSSLAHHASEGLAAGAAQARGRRGAGSRRCCVSSSRWRCRRRGRCMFLTAIRDCTPASELKTGIELPAVLFSQLDGADGACAGRPVP